MSGEDVGVLEGTGQLVIHRGSWVRGLSLMAGHGAELTTGVVRYTDGSRERVRSELDGRTTRRVLEEWAPTRYHPREVAEVDWRLDHD